MRACRSAERGLMASSKPPTPRARARLCLAAAAAVCAVSPTAHAVVQNVVVNNNIVGVTPRYLGFNMGHYMPNSNTTAWVQYSGTNAYRVWASANDYEGDPPTGDDNGN